MKKFLSILLAVVLCFSVCSVVAFAADEAIAAKAVPSKTSLSKGDTFTVDFKLTTNKGFTTLGLLVGYDANVLEVVCPKHKDGSKCSGARLPVTNMLATSPDGAANSAACSPYHDTNPYKIMWAFGLAEEDVVATERVATLTFKVKDNAKFGTTAITLNVDQASGLNGAYDKTQLVGTGADLTVACKTHTKDAGTVTKEPTCTAKGTKAYKCKDCGADMGTEDIKATGHDWGNWEGTADAKCGTKGEETRVCKNDATHTEKRTTAALEHLWNEGEVTTAPTCDKDGVKTFKCTRTDCDGSKTEAVKKLGHKFGDWKVTTEPTCEDKGVETRTCTNANCTEKETRDVKATGHKFGDWKVTTEPTCEDKGVETRVCANDAAHKETRPVDALGHDFDYENPVVTKEPTCTEEGEEEYECLNGCGEVDTGVIDALGHIVDWEITKEATVDEEGERTGTCEECGEAVTEVIPKLTATLEGKDKLSMNVVGANGEVTEGSVDGFKVESGDDEPFSGYVQGEIYAGVPEGEDAKTESGKTAAIAYVISLFNADTGEYVADDKLVTLTIPVSNDLLAAYENLVLIGLDANGDEVVIDGAKFADGAFVVTAEYSKLAAVVVAGDKIVVEEEKEETDTDKDNSDATVEEEKKEETTSPPTGDTAAIAFVVVMLAIAASVLVFTSKKVRA